METPTNLSLLRRLNLNHLVGFLAIAECQSFRLAASRLHLSQSALSVQIHQLEETLGVPLFHRTTRSVAPTDEGKRLLPVARLLAQEMTLVASEFREEAALHRGIATLAATPSITSFLIPPVLKALADAYPGIRIQLLVKESSKAVAELVREGEADVGVLNFSDDMKGLAVTKLIEDEVVAVVPASERKLATLKQVTLRQLSGFPFVIQPRGSFIREELEAHLQDEGIELDIRHELLQPDVSVALVSQGLAVAILPVGALAPLNLAGCRVIRLRAMRSRAVGLVTSTRRSVSPSAGLLRKFIVEAGSGLRRIPPSPLGSERQPDLRKAGRKRSRASAAAPP